MFQYAAGRRLAHTLGVELKLDIAAFANCKLRTYSLGNFNIQENFASSEEVAALTVGKGGFVERVLTRLLGRRAELAATYIKQKHFHFDPDILNLPDGVYLHGYWQSEKYFADIAGIIRREFTVKSPQSGRDEELAAQMASSESVSLHIRRGDYLSNPNTNRVHGVCDMDYYNHCVECLTEKVKNPHFFIFSDDPEWAHDNLKLPYASTIIDHNGVKKDWEDLRLMTQCKHHIIANSSFSWWGAWLNSRRDKIVFAPRQWFSEEEQASRKMGDLLPAAWIKLQKRTVITNPKVTVLMSVYNGEGYLREAIDSVLSQTYSDFEFLIIDDGSTDGSVDIIRSYLDPRIRLIENEKNIGLTRSLNKGLKLSRGEYIARMDGDDIALPERLEKQVHFLNEHVNVGLVGGSDITINGVGDEIGFRKKLTNNGALKQGLLAGDNQFCHPSSMFRKECIEKVGPYREEFKMAQDYDLWLRIAEEFELANIEEALCKHRIIPDSISTSKQSQQEAYHRLAHSLALQRRIFGVDEFGYKPPGEPFQSLRCQRSMNWISRRRIMSNIYFMWSQKYPYKNGRRRRGKIVEYLLKSLINNPLNRNAWTYIYQRVARKTQNLLCVRANRTYGE